MPSFSQTLRPIHRVQSLALQKYPIELTRTRDVVPRHTKLRFRNPVLATADICFCFKDGFVKQGVSLAINEKNQRQPRLAKISRNRHSCIASRYLRTNNSGHQNPSILVIIIGCVGVNHSRLHIKMQRRSFARRTPYVARFVGSYSIIASVRTLILP